MKKLAKVLVGERIFLSEIEEEELIFARKLRNDNRVWFGDQSEVYTNDQEKWFEHYQERNNDILWVICPKGYRIVIGTIGLDNIVIGSEAELGRRIIDFKYRRKGYAKEATKLVLDYAFMEMKLQKVYCYVRFNNISVKMLGKLFGFREIKTGNEFVTLEVASNEYKKI